MGSALSLPLISMLALPFYSGPATSMNLLLLTFNWYLLLLSHPPLLVEIYGTLAIKLACYVLPSLLFLAFDNLIPSLSAEIKALGEIGLPSKSVGRAKKQLRVLGWSMFNFALGIALQAAIEMLCTKVLGVRSAMSLSKTMPMPWQMIRTVMGLLVARGILTFFIHRYTLHEHKNPLSKAHAEWAHSLPAPFSLVATYDHPAAYLLHRWLPLYLPAYAFRVHLLPFLIALAFTSAEETFTYSGYSATLLPSAIMLPGMARRVDNHYLAKGRGNYAAFGALDWVCGTSIGSGDLVEDLQKEWDMRDGSEKVAKAKEGTAGFIEGVRAKAIGRRRGKK